jgi:hypothetical protein
MIDDPRITKDKDYRHDLVKRHALGVAIYEDALEGSRDPPFKHT